MAQAARREDSVEFSISELRSLEDQRRTEEKERQLAAERQRREAEERREQVREQLREAAEADQRRIAVATAEQARIDAERARIEAEAAAAQRAAELRLTERRAALELERARTHGAPMSLEAPSRGWISPLLFAVLLAACAIGFLELRAAADRDRELRLEIDRATAGIDRVDTALRARLDAVDQRLAEPTAAPVPPATAPARPTHRPTPRPRPGPSARPSQTGPGAVVLDCDVSSPLCH